MSFLYELTNIICNPPNINKANNYLISRGIDPSLMRYSFAISDSDENPFKKFSNLFPPNIFIDSLYIPILQITNSTALAGYDVRYLGNASFRTRFHKFKDTTDTFLIYSSKNIEQIKDDEPIVVVEGVLDALSIEQLGYTVLTPLTALNTLKFCIFLYSISNRIFFMYDNDDTGRRALQKLMKHVSLDLDIKNSFRPIIYSGKDPNDALLTMGKGYLQTVLKSHLGV